MFGWIIFTVFTMLAIGFAWLARPTPGGVNVNTILILPAAACGLAAGITLVVKILVHYLLKI